MVGTKGGKGSHPSSSCVVNFVNVSRDNVVAEGLGIVVQEMESESSPALPKLLPP